jgi:endonuclease-8
MPEGPTMLILREECEPFVGRKVLRVEGNSKLPDLQRMQGRKVLAFRTWGKHFLICFSGFTMRVHLMLFGSYRIDERREAAPRLSLGFTNGELNFYACSLKFIEGPLDEAYDWSADVLSPDWSPKAAREKLLARPDLLACDALLDQNIFAGVGNIIKNEVLFRIRLHPLSTIGALPARKLTRLIAEARNYSFDFLEWKRAYVLKKHWLVHRQKDCPECGAKLRIAHLGRTHRRAFFCENCQELLGGPAVPPEPMYPPRRRATAKPAAKPATRARPR